MNQLEEQVAALIDIIRLDDEALESAKEKLVQLADTENKSDLVSIIETQKRREILLVQWELEEVLNILNPPKEEAAEEVDDPSKVSYECPNWSWFTKTQEALCCTAPRLMIAGLSFKSIPTHVKWFAMRSPQSRDRTFINS